MFAKESTEKGQVGIGTLIVFIAMVLVAAIAAGVLINTAGMLQSQAEATGEESTDLVSERIDVTSEVGIVASGDYHTDLSGGADRGELAEIRISVTGAPGADDIDLGETIVQVVGPEGQANLVLADPTAGDDDQIDDTEENGFMIVDNDGDDPADTAEPYNIRQGYFAVENEDGDFEAASEAVITDETDEFTLVFNPLVAPFGTQGTDTEVDDNDLYLDTEGNGEEAFGTGDESTVQIVSPESATTEVEFVAPDLFNKDGEAVRL